MAVLLALTVAGADAQSRAVHTATGVVIMVDREMQKMTVDAAPVPELSLPALALSFLASNRSLLEKVRVGQRVQVEFVELGRNFSLTRVTPLPATPKASTTHESWGY